MKIIPLAAVLLLGSLAADLTSAQHCAPIVESYLSEIAIKHQPGAIELRIEYAKRGGQFMSAYQVYVVAYLEKDRSKVPAAAPRPILDPQVAITLHSQVVKRNSQGRFGMKLKLEHNQLAQQIIEHAKLTADDSTSAGGWGSYRDKIRIAVFIPFLEDEMYSNLKGLPEERHECNYTRERALLFQELPYTLSIHFGIVQATRLKEGTFHIQINGDKPAKAKRE